MMRTTTIRRSSWRSLSAAAAIGLAAAAVALADDAASGNQPAAGASTRATVTATTRPATGKPGPGLTGNGAPAVPAGATATTTASAATKPALEPITPPSPADLAKIETAIKDLSADSWKQRQAAQDTLVTFGEAAIPSLRPLAAKSDDEEVRTRAGAALRQIEENAQVGGSVVTLKMKDAKPADVFAALGKQARCEFNVYPKNLWEQGGRRFGGGGVPPTISVDLERVNFWTAFKEVCQKSGVHPQQMGNNRGMTLSQGTHTYWNGPSVTSGPFLVVANRLDHSRSVDLANPTAVQNNFTMQLAAFAEPKVKVVQSSYNVQVHEAVDDKGNNLANTDRTYDHMSSGQQWMWNLSARLNYPEKNPGTKIVKFRGSVKFMVQTKSETLDLSDVLTVKDKTVNVAGRRILVKHVKKNGEQFEVAMTIYRDQMNQQDWNMLSYPGYAVRLLDKDGKSLNSNGWGGGGGGDSMNYTWNFSKQSWGGDEDKPGEPHRLVWEIPMETREMAVEFSFKDLPMPGGAK
jgi:hypothetical protein